MMVLLYDDGWLYRALNLLLLYAAGVSELAFTASRFIFFLLLVRFYCAHIPRAHKQSLASLLSPSLPSVLSSFLFFSLRVCCSLHDQ